MKITLFFAAGAIYAHAHREKISELDGIGRAMPWTMSAFAVASIGLAGLPPVNGFESKWFIGAGAASSGQELALIVLLISGILNAAYFFPIVYRAFLRGSEQYEGMGEASPLMVVPLVGTAALALLTGVWPNVLVRFYDLAVDVGANAGLFTKILGEQFDRVIGIDVLPFSNETGDGLERIEARLQAGEADIAISGLTMLTMRNMKVAFAGPYFISGKSFLTKYQNLADAKRIDAVDVKDVTLTALKGSTSQMLVEEVIPEVKLIPAASYAEATRLLDEDQVHALVADYPYCFYAVLRNPAKQYIASITPITYEPLGIAMPGDFLSYELETFDAVLRVNLRGVFVAMQRAARATERFEAERASAWDPARPGPPLPIEVRPEAGETS